MLVLTRKADEQILIGDDIKITLVRVRGNSVRLGIDAPRDVRIVRAELDSLDAKSDSEVTVDIDDRAEVFAHPQPDLDTVAMDCKPSNRLSKLIEPSGAETDSDPSHSIFVGRIHRPETNNRIKHAPLAGFVTPK